MAAEDDDFVEKSMLEVIHDSVISMYKAGVIDKATMREYDELCLPKIEPLTPQQIQNIRLHEKASQAVFAKYLNLNASTIRQWEQGVKKPNNAALLLLYLVAHKGFNILKFHR